MPLYTKRQPTPKTAKVTKRKNPHEDVTEKVSVDDGV